MHVELVVPALLRSAAAAPALELLLARGRRAEAQAASLEDWLGRAFGLGEAPLPAGALSALAAGAGPGRRALAARRPSSPAPRPRPGAADT
jgi:hypothetical protein